MARLMTFLSEAVESGKFGNEQTNDLIKDLLEEIPNIIEATDHLTQAMAESNKSSYREVVQSDINKMKNSGE